MADLYIPFNDLLRKNNTNLRQRPRKRSSIHDEFLKEAYRINNHIASLHVYLTSIRRAYLSTAPPPRRPNAFHPQNPNTLSRPNSPLPPHSPTHLDNTSKDAIDASTKTLLRDLSASLNQLASAESVRRETDLRKLQAKHSKNFLGKWAAGAGGGDEKSPEQSFEEAGLDTLRTFRESVIWYIGRKLEEAGEVQRAMMERRLERELEKGRSVLYKVRGAQGLDSPDYSSGQAGGMNGHAPDGGGGAGNKGRAGPARAAAAADDERRREIEQQLSPEQLQLFAQENQDMLKQYEDTLDQVRTAERSMLEISELQTQLVQNLDIQSENISQLVADSLSTTENVGGGNKQLKRAMERKSTARMVFWASCALCGFLVTWDLIF